MLRLAAHGNRVREPRELRFEAKVRTDPTAIQKRIESACTLGVRAVGRRRSHRRKQCRQVRRLIINHVVNPMRRRRRIDQASHSLGDIGVMSERHAQSRREAAHHRNDLLNVRITVAIHERESQHPYIETFDLEEKALRGEFARGVGGGWRAGIILVSGPTPGRTVDQPGARKDKAPHRGGPGRVGELPRAGVIDRMRLLSTRAAKECRAVDHDIDAPHRRRKRIRVEQIPLHQLDTIAAQVSGTRPITEERAHLMSPLCQPSGKAAPDLSGRPSHKNFHAPNLAGRASPGLGKTDMPHPRLRHVKDRKHNRSMLESAAHPKRIVPRASTASAIAALSVTECASDRSLIAIPRPEVQIVARFGPSARNGLDIHAMGAQQKVRRKLIRAGQRAVTVRLHLGATEAVLGVPASEITGRILDLDDLWGEPPTRRLLDRLATARTVSDATTILETAISERLTSVDAHRPRSHLALRATERLTSASVKTVAADLGVSERQLRRVFQQSIGVTPKSFARLARFHHALRTAREDRHTTWASIAATAGYYDQAHLIEDFRAIAGVTPRTLLGELSLSGWHYPT